MIPKRLTYGDTIGVVSPSHVAERERYRPMLEGLRKLGFHVKEGKNLYRDTYGYLASEQERRKTYAITQKGLDALRVEYRRLKHMVQDGAALEEQT